jgi:hypothetical protein
VTRRSTALTDSSSVDVGYRTIFKPRHCDRHRLVPYSRCEDVQSLTCGDLSAFEQPTIVVVIPFEHATEAKATV